VIDRLTEGERRVGFGDEETTDYHVRRPADGWVWREETTKVVEEDESTSFTIADLSMEMLWVEPGTFEMGSQTTEAGRGNNETPYTVTLTSGFYLGKHEVTQTQWEKVMGSNPNKFKGADRPVEEVSWNDVTSFCEKLTELESEAGRLPAGMTYQLPTEAEWEYACRAGTTTAFSFGDELTAKDANYAHDGYGTGLQRTSNVGEYAANPWGFHDMHGNVWEWCADWVGKISVLTFQACGFVLSSGCVTMGLVRNRASNKPATTR
jgi:formylglycine-generating enzyme required for sulfatase activity